ncbi:MAG: hypothetical protein EA422_01250 [Gemmatimonadales bacterium]|nr:MAG: hypothetical protein EA422_01250 [Gemmatimonadales bacterium]
MTPRRYLAMSDGTPVHSSTHPPNGSTWWSVEAVGEVVGSIAREIGAPLTAIEVAVDRLRRRAASVDGGSESEELQVILEQSHRLAGLARTLLSLARPLQTLPREVRLDQLVDGIAASVGPEMHRVGIALDVEHRDGSLTILGDPHQIREALTALIANARLALEGWSGERMIHLTTGALEDGRRFVRVQDSGPGVPLDKQERIFLPFFSDWGREGIGLALSRIAVLGQQGEVYLEGEGCGEEGDGREPGATFILVLPASPSDEVP